MLDPRTLTPETLYKLQSDTWVQGADYERERIIKLLEERTDDSGSVLDETGNSIADLSDLIELIKGETK